MNSTPYGRRLIVREDGVVQVVGVDHETRDIKVVARNNDYIVIKIAGRSCWSGNYTPREYHPPQIEVFQIIKENGEVLDVEPLIEWDCGRKKVEK